ncbi:hypothetical protein [Nostoc sp.]|uniref:hypothetical protein n=1 Tax=Nostoc sp. TaxID=1180 RepID=UPI002FF26476
MKVIWENFAQKKDLNYLVFELDEFFFEQDQYYEIEEETEFNPSVVIKEEDIQLVCYQWFQPT